jgi:hypothetical protein
MMLSNIPANYWLGFALLIWLVYDLATGEVYLHRAIQSNSEPLTYWFVMLIWGVIAMSCFAFPYLSI